MSIVHKKIWPEYFDLVASGKKKFELRLADFDVAESDTMVLEEWDPKTKEYTGRTMEVTVTMVRKTKDQKFWSAEDVERHGFQILQIEPKDNGITSSVAVPPGVYEHYKGGRYEVLGVATHSESGEQVVTYRALDGDRRLWVRPMAMFTETVGVKGKRVPRFRRVGE